MRIRKKHTRFLLKGKRRYNHFASSQKFLLNNVYFSTEERMPYQTLYHLQLAKRVDFLWRFAKATYLKSGIEGSRGNMDAKKDLVYAAKELAIKAEQTDDKNAEVQKWYNINVYLSYKCASFW